MKRGQRAVAAVPSAAVTLFFTEQAADEVSFFSGKKSPRKKGAECQNECWSFLYWQGRMSCSILKNVLFKIYGLMVKHYRNHLTSC